MASKNFARALRATSARQFVAPAVQKRALSTALKGARPSTLSATKTIAGGYGQTRGVKTIDFAGHKEKVYERSDWPREKLLVSIRAMLCPCPELELTTRRNTSRTILLL